MKAMNLTAITPALLGDKEIISSFLFILTGKKIVVYLISLVQFHLVRASIKHFFSTLSFACPKVQYLSLKIIKCLIELLASCF